VGTSTSTNISLLLNGDRNETKIQYSLCLDMRMNFFSNDEYVIAKLVSTLPYWHPYLGHINVTHKVIYR